MNGGISLAFVVALLRKASYSGGGNIIPNLLCPILRKKEKKKRNVGSQILVRQVGTR